MIMSFSKTFSHKSVKSTEIRKIRKPLMEKKRRARINSSLEKLKKMILSYSTAVKEDPQPAKWEKADILEMTVRHLQRLHQLIFMDGKRTDGAEGCGRPAGIVAEEPIPRVPSWEWGRGQYLCCTGCEGDDEGKGKGSSKGEPLDPPTQGSEKRAGALPVGGAQATAQSKRGRSPPPGSSRKSGAPPPPKEGGHEGSQGRCRVWRPWQVASRSPP